MPWFLVGDQLHSAPMLRKILAIEPAAVGLWTVAGSWSSEYLTEGFIPDDALQWLFPDAPKLACALVTAGAWKRVKNGHRFVTDDVTHRIPKKQAVDNDRKAAAERQRRSRERKSSRRDAGVTNGVSHTAQSNPDPYMAGLVNLTNGSSPPAVSHDLISTITDEIEHCTGRVIDPAWAARIARHILGDREVRDPASYVTSAIRAEANPRVRFLPVA